MKLKFPVIDAATPEKIEFTENGRLVLEKRYLKKDDRGEPIESAEDMFRRVAANVAQAELTWGSTRLVHLAEEEFYGMMARLEFLPNSPTLMNAGRRLQQLAACFVLPVPDDIEKIFDAIKYAAIIHKSGGGTGFSFSRIRPGGDLVESSRGRASGPISFMKVFNYATGAINQGGFRRGANMGVLRCDHPDVEPFACAKAQEGELENFNISIACTAAFMDAVRDGKSFDLINPHGGRVMRRQPARQIWETMVTQAHGGGDPGAIFLDRINADNPTPHLGHIECTNPCGEQPLLPYEACNLGSVNLNKVVDNGHVDWDHLGAIVRLAVRFLDDCIQMSRYPLPQITEMVMGNRKIGLGVMGFADMLLRLGVRYDSAKALEIAHDVMHFVRNEADRASASLADDRGPFPNIHGSIYDRPESPAYRNACRTTVAPTGSLSIIAGCSSGIEPIFALVMERHVLDGARLFEVHPIFEAVGRQRGFWSRAMIDRVASAPSLKKVKGVPKDVAALFTTAHEIGPKWHVEIQAAFQKHADNAVSKTVNLPNDATVEDVANVYWMAYEMGCKGITVYRDRSRTQQVLVRAAVTGDELEPAPLSCNRPELCGGI
ncbi:MAG TPA: adenosylcobalamin-dependent ribonucleoside-diphosphate reductase [Phycisphaerae bacterium]|nr:adenosylcobalamin-dependent ribonucleoside-diphosphate reductase [Phycisphaerae bacterium]